MRLPRRDSSAAIGAGQTVHDTKKTLKCSKPEGEKETANEKNRPIVSMSHLNETVTWATGIKQLCLENSGGRVRLATTRRAKQGSAEQDPAQERTAALARLGFLLGA